MSWNRETVVWENGSHCSRTETSSRPTLRQKNEVIRSCSETISPSREPLECVASGDYHKQLVLSVSTYGNGGWKYEFKTSSLTTTILNLIFNEAERNGKSHNFRTYIGPGSDVSSTDNLSLVLKFNPRNTAMSSRPGEEHFSCKTVPSHYDLQEDWCTEQKDVWLDWVKTFSYRPVRCLITVHPYFSAQRRTELLAKSVHLSRAKFVVNVPCSPSDPYIDKRATLNKKQENGTAKSETFAMETNQASRNWLTNAISHGQTIVYTMISVLETHQKASGYFLRYLILEKNGLQLTDDSETKLKNEFVLTDRKRHFFFPSR